VARRRWWPDWRDTLIWRLGLMLGMVNATYFTTNAFLPDYLRSNGQSEWISAALVGTEYRPAAGVDPVARGLPAGWSARPGLMRFVACSV